MSSSHLLNIVYYKSRQSYKLRHLCFLQITRKELLQITAALKIIYYEPGVDPAGVVL